MNPPSRFDVRNVLACYFDYLSMAQSYWFTLNLSSDEETHLSHRLGLTNNDDYQTLLVAAGLAKIKGGKFCILKEEWEIFRRHEYFITNSDTDELPEGICKSKQNSMSPSKPLIFEIELTNINNNGVRQSLYSLRIGKMDISSPLQFTSQKKMCQSPPRMSKILRVQQQAFLSYAANIIANTEIHLGSFLCDEVEPMITAGVEEEDSTNPTTNTVSPNTTMMATTTTTTTTTAAVSHGSNDLTQTNPASRTC